MLNILMVGPSRNANGGMTTVVNNYFDSSLIDKVNLKYISTTKDGNIFIRIAYNFIAYIKIFLYLLIKKVDIVHIHMASRGSFFRKSLIVRYSRFLGKKIIIHLHGGKFNDFYMNSPGIIRKYISYIFNSAHHVIILSEEWRNIILSYNVTTKISVIYNGVKINKNSYDVNSNYILYLGRINSDKGVYDLVQAIKELVSDIPNIKLILGGVGEENRLMTLIEDNRLNQNIKFIGWVRGGEKESLISEAKAFILPSYFEAMPMSILEAMSYGIPIISTRVGGIPTLVKDNNQGYLFPPGDIKGLKDCIRKIYTDSDKNLILSKNSYEKLVNNFSLDKSHEKLLSIYYSLINR